MIFVRSWPARPTKGGPAGLHQNPVLRRRRRVRRGDCPSRRQYWCAWGRACSAGSRRCRARMVSRVSMLAEAEVIRPSSPAPSSRGTSPRGEALKFRLSTPMSLKNSSWEASSSGVILIIAAGYRACIRSAHFSNCTTRSRILSARTDLLTSGISSVLPGLVDDCRVIHIAIEGRIRTTYGIDDDEIQILGFEFFEAVLHVIFRFGSKTYEHGTVLAAAEFLENVWRGLEIENQIRADSF